MLENPGKSMKLCAKSLKIWIKSLKTMANMASDVV